MFRKLRRSKDKKEWTKHDEKVLQAVRDGDTEKLQHVLTKKGTSPSKANKEGQTALHVAAGCGQLPSLEIMLALGANVHLRDKEGMTALHLAAREGHGSVSTRLVQAGTALDIQDNSGQTALHYAAIGGFVDCAVLFMQAKASKDTPDENQKTPLMYASQFGYTAVCKELIDRGAAVNAEDNEMKTPLILACENGHNEVVDLLVKRGARIDARDVHGYDAIFYAAKSDNPEIITALESAPPVASWDIKSEEEELANQVQPDSVDYVDAFHTSGEEDPENDGPSPREEKTAPSRAISMPALTAANIENDNEKVLHELEEENEMLNDEIQQLQVTNKRNSDKIKQLQLELEKNDVESLKAELEEERERNRKATQEIELMKKETASRTHKMEDTEDEEEEKTERDSWGDSDEDLFELPGLGPTKSTKDVFQRSSSSKSTKQTAELFKLKEENEELRNKLKSASTTPHDAKVIELVKQVETLQKKLEESQVPNSSSSSADHEKLLEEKEKELESLQKVTSLLRDKVSSLNNSLAEVTAENEELKNQERVPTFEPSSNSPRFHLLLKEKAILEKKVKELQALSEEQQKQIETLGGVSVKSEGAEEIQSDKGDHLQDKIDELTKENTRLQSTVAKQSKAIAQQTERSRKDKEKYATLLAEKEKLEAVLKEDHQSREGIQSTDLEKECKELKEKLALQEKSLAADSVEKEKLEKLILENSRLKDTIHTQEELLKEKQPGTDNLRHNLLITEQLSAEIEEVKVENAKLKSHLDRQEGLLKTYSENEEVFASLAAEKESLEKKLRSVSEELELMRTAQTNFSKRKYTEVLLENRKLKETLQSETNLPNGEVKHSLKQDNISQLEVERLRGKLDQKEKQLDETVMVYRQHLLNAVQGNMDPSIKEALLQIVKLRASNGGSG